MAGLRDTLIAVGKLLPLRVPNPSSEISYVREWVQQFEGQILARGHIVEFDTGAALGVLSLTVQNPLHRKPRLAFRISLDKPSGQPTASFSGNTPYILLSTCTAESIVIAGGGNWRASGVFLVL